MATKTPRAAATYRGARRNKFRAAGHLNRWRHADFAVQANMRAELPARREQCHRAIQAVFAAAAHGRDRVTALRQFWGSQKRTRVVHRILKTI